MTERFHEFFQTVIQSQRTPETEVKFESIAKAHFSGILRNFIHIHINEHSWLIFTIC